MPVQKIKKLRAEKAKSYQKLPAVNKKNSGVKNKKNHRNQKPRGAEVAESCRLQNKKVNGKSTLTKQKKVTKKSPVTKQKKSPASHR